MPENKAYGANTAFLDLLMLCVLGVLVLLFLAFNMINPVLKKNELKNKAEFIISITWPDGNKDDVDTWLEDPLGNVLYFKNKEAGFMTLDRDDLGVVRDRVTLADGTVVSSSINQEITTIRGFLAGEWVLNIHMYKKNEAMPTEVIVKMDKLNPFSPVCLKKILLSSNWQEITVLRFVMTQTGDILSTSNLPKGLVRDSRIFRPSSRDTTTHDPA